MITVSPEPSCLPYSESEIPDLASDSLAQWYVVHSKPRAEKMAGVYLNKLGIEILCPYIRQKKVIRRKQVIQEVPLFPGYLFAKFNPIMEFRAVQYATGVRCVVSFGEALAMVDAILIDAMRDRIYQGNVIVTQTIAFQPGQKVRIHDGPLQGFEAVFECEMSDKQRVALLLKTVAYQARVVVPVDQITGI